MNALDAKGLAAAAEADARCQRERCKVSACNGFLCHAAITAYLSAVSPPDNGEPVATALQQRCDKLVEALRMARCPRPANHRPDEFDIGDCCDAGECGCFARAALQGSAKQ